MTTSLLIILIATLLLRRWPEWAAYRREHLFQTWLSQLSRREGAVYVGLALGLPLLLCLLVIAGIDILPGRGLGQCLFALAVLMLCLGPRELDPDLQALQQARDPASQLQALTDLHDETTASLSWDPAAVAETTAYAALHRQFGVVFWFVLLGPPGALLYRLGQRLGRDASLDLKPAQRNPARQLANALDWLPAQLLVFTLAVVDQWEAVMQAWQSWRQTEGRAGWYHSAPGFLAAAVRSSSVPPGEASTDPLDAGHDPALVAGRLRQVFRRAWFAWLAVLALLAVGGWISQLS